MFPRRSQLLIFASAVVVLYYIRIFHLCRRHGKSIMGVTAPNVPENDFADTISILFGKYKWMCPPVVYKIMLYFYLYCFQKIKISSNEWVGWFSIKSLTQKYSWSFGHGHLKFSSFFSKINTWPPAEFDCLHRIDRRYGIFWEDICFQLQVLFLGTYMNSNIDESLKPHMDKNVLGLLSCETCQTGRRKSAGCSLYKVVTPDLEGGEYL